MTGDPERDGPTDRPETGARAPTRIRRWARRKGRAQEGGQDPSPAADPNPAQAGDAAATHRRAAEAVSQPTDADMPPLDSLGEGSDFRGFLSPRVSESLRRAALRKLFQSPPVRHP